MNFNNKRFRNIVFTLNNYTDEDIAMLKGSEHVQYGFFGREIAPTTGTPHLQGYLQLKKQLNGRALKRFMPRADIEAAKGTAEQSKTYCSKETVLEEWGKEKNPGKRNDLNALKEQVDTGAPLVEVISQCVNFQQIRFTEKLYEYKPLSAEYKKRQVYWFWGSTGSGKTRAAYDLVKEQGKDFWRSTLNGGSWFNGYWGQPIAILDEVRAKKWPYGDMLELLDGYEIRIPNKGGFTIWNPEIVIITSPKKPEDCYEGQLQFGDGHIDQLLRRITEVREFKAEPELEPPRKKRKIMPAEDPLAWMQEFEKQHPQINLIDVIKE